MVVHHNRGVQSNLSFRKESLVQDGSGEKQQNLGTRISMTLVIQNAKETSLSFSFDGSMRLFSGSVRHIDGGTNGPDMTFSFGFGGGGTEPPVRLTTTVTPGEDELSSNQNFAPGVRGVENGDDAPSVHPDVGQSNVESISNEARTPQDGDETCHEFTGTSPAPEYEEPTEKPTFESASLPSPAFKPFIVRNDEGRRVIYEHMQSISAMDAYRDCSFEEIRAKEYKNRQDAAESVAQKECPISPKETEPVTENGIAINAALHQPPSGDPISISFSFGESDQPDLPDPISNSSSRTLVEDEDALSGSLFRLNINTLEDGVSDRVSDGNNEGCAGRSPARDGSLNAGVQFDNARANINIGQHHTEASEGPQSDPTILLPQPVDQQRNAWLGPIGTAKAPFRSYCESPLHNSGVLERHQCISAMIEYRNYSTEELRAQDYIQGRKSSGNCTTAKSSTSEESNAYGSLTSGFEDHVGSPCTGIDRISNNNEPCVPPESEPCQWLKPTEGYSQEEAPGEAADGEGKVAEPEGSGDFVQPKKRKNRKKSKSKCC